MFVIVGDVILSVVKNLKEMRDCFGTSCLAITTPRRCEWSGVISSLSPDCFVRPRRTRNQPCHLSLTPRSMKMLFSYHIETYPPGPLPLIFCLREGGILIREGQSVNGVLRFFVATLLRMTKEGDCFGRPRRPRNDRLPCRIALSLMCLAVTMGRNSWR